MQAEITVPPRTTQDWQALDRSVEKSRSKLESMPAAERSQHLDLGGALREDWRHLAPEAMQRRWALQERLADAEQAVHVALEGIADAYGVALEGSYARSADELAASRSRLGRAVATLTARLDEAEQQLGGGDGR